MTPEMRKALGTLTDCQLLHVVSEIMSYDYQETYALAHKQVQVEGDPWESWSHNFSLVKGSGNVLPVAVRQELQEAMDRFRDEDRIKAKYFRAIHRANAYVNAVGRNGEPGYKRDTLFGSSSNTILKWMGWLFLAWWIMGFVQSCAAGS
jgi:hypothetical protein|tara:strand:- start:293 stop:739 length:447 start_codon:yes stop_codon:yes gene_type:complete